MIQPERVLRLDPPGAADMLADLGFIAGSDLPDRPGPAYLLVALRAAPTLHHYDPERVEYWTTVAGRGVRRVLSRGVPLPVDVDVSWGLIRIVDRLGVSNEYVTFGGRLTAATVDGATVAVFTSPAPLLRRGGHSQGWDHGAECVGAFFGRLLVAVDYVPGFEARLASVAPLVRYAAFVGEVVGRYSTSGALRSGHPELWSLLETDQRRLQLEHAGDWALGLALLRDLEPAPSERSQRF